MEEKEIKLNLGSANTKKEGFINIDVKKFENVDIVHDIEKPLPFENNTVKEIYSSHSLERCIMYKIPAILKDWYRVLKKGGTIRIIVPEITSCMKTFLAAEDSDPEKWTWKLSYIVAGMHKKEERELHKSAFTLEKLKKFVETAGFKIIETKVVETKRNDCIHLHATKIYTNNTEGYMREGELDFLYRASQRYTSILEIGCWKGKSTVALLEGSKGKVTVVDHFKGTPNSTRLTPERAENAYEDFIENTKRFNNLRIIKKSSKEAKEILKEEKFEMIFIDGDHSYDSIKEDIVLWKKNVTKFISGHDYLSNFPGAMKAVNEEFEKNQIKRFNSIWYVDLEK